MGTWFPPIFYVGFVVEAALIANLLRNGLFRIYRWFFIYLLTDLVGTGLGALLQTNRHLYAQIYFVGQSLKIGLVVMVVLELYQLALVHHPALSQYGRTTVTYVMAGAAIAAAVTVLLDRTPRKGSPVLFEFFAFQRTMNIWMLLFLAIIALLMAWFPLVLKRNATLYIGGFVIYFLTQSAGYWAANFRPALRGSISEAMLVVSTICLTVWFFALTRHGEEVTTVVGHRWNPEDGKRVMAQLDAINAKLARLAQR